MPASTARAPVVWGAVGLVVATSAAVISLHGGGTAAVLAQAHLVGISYLAAGVIAWAPPSRQRTFPPLRLEKASAVSASSVAEPPGPAG
jgi:hypothetical protein